MRRLTSKTSTTRSANVSVLSDLLAEAQEAGIDLSDVLEKALIEELAATKRRKWLEDNREAIDAYNEHIAKDGVFSDGVRFF
jgi:antitoxin CcdA